MKKKLTIYEDISKRIPKVEEIELANALAMCAYQAYFPDNPQTPAGYKFIKGIECTNNFMGNEGTKKYAIVYQNKSDTDEYIIAFRGTSNDADAIKDIEIAWSKFKPTHNPRRLSMYDIDIHDGFQSMYNAKGGRDDKSFRERLFDFMNEYKPQKLNITGHSLGSALATIFNFDLYISVENPPEITHINFACPRVGSYEFAKMYRRFDNEKTLRIVNFHDEVPCVPKHPFRGYYHAPNYFLIFFNYDYDWLVNHSMKAYEAVLADTLIISNQQLNEHKNINIKGTNYDFDCTYQSGVKECTWFSGEADAKN